LEVACGRSAGLARAITDATLAVANHDQRCEAEASAALHHLGDAIDVDQLFGALAVFALPPLPVAIPSAPVALGTCLCACHADPFRNPDRPRGRRRPRL